MKHSAVERQRRTGGGGLPQDAEERFSSKTRQGDNGCIIWDGAVNSRGFGSFCYGGRRKSVLAHRWAWEHLAGRRIPDTAVLSHACGNRLCVNTEHMFLTDPVAATLAGGSPAAENLRKTHCNRGHLLGEPVERSRGAKKRGLVRRCAECARVSRAHYELRKREERKAVRRSL